MYKMRRPYDFSLHSLLQNFVLCKMFCNFVAVNIDTHNEMMKRKYYMKPAIRIVKLQQHRLLYSSPKGDLPDSQKPTTYDWD